MQYDVEDIWFKSLVVKIQNVHKSHRHRVNLFIHRIKSYGFKVLEPDEWVRPKISNKQLKILNADRKEIRTEIKEEKFDKLDNAPTDAKSCTKAKIRIGQGWVLKKTDLSSLRSIGIKNV